MDDDNLVNNNSTWYRQPFIFITFILITIITIFITVLIFPTFIITIMNPTITRRVTLPHSHYLEASPALTSETRALPASRGKPRPLVLEQRQTTCAAPFTLVYLCGRFGFNSATTCPRVLTAREGLVEGSGSVGKYLFGLLIAHRILPSASF